MTSSSLVIKESDEISFVFFMCVVLFLDFPLVWLIHYQESSIKKSKQFKHARTFYVTTITNRTQYIYTSTYECKFPPIFGVPSRAFTGYETNG